MSQCPSTTLNGTARWTDTRSRVLGVEDANLGTFNAGGRRTTNSLKGRNPQGEYQRNESAVPNHHECFPYTVKGQHILHSACNEVKGPAEDYRKAGSLSRNIAGSKVVTMA